ncbi:MAG: aminotransferase class V-fold PLP-dependent enzyme [Planctomycetota bacterium]
MPRPTRLYFDHAATSFPKPPAVIEGMVNYATQLGASPGRGAYQEARESAAILSDCRAAIAALLNHCSPNHVIFTLNTTDALNLGIRGILTPYLNVNQSVHVITTDMDHNSVLRPLNELAAHHPDLSVTRVQADPTTGLIDPEDERTALTPATRLVAAVHASNVTGTIQPIREIGSICKQLGVPLLVDAAQSLGHIPVDVEASHIDLLAAPGHKGLLGPLGTGFLAIRPGLEQSLATYREGGTGSASDLDTQPTNLPDKYEPGSHNTVGIAGLLAGVQHILDQGIESIAAHEQQLTEQFLEELRRAELPNLKLHGPPTIAHRLGVFSITIDGLTPDELAARLEDEYGILTRPGIHCAPGAHETLRTDPANAPTCPGTTRFSIGHNHTAEDIAHATRALIMLASEAAHRASPAHAS